MNSDISIFSNEGRVETTVVINKTFQESPRTMEFAAEFNKSWLVRVGNDRNRSYFTFYSEFNRSFPEIVYVEILFLCLLTVISTLGNFLITYVVLSNKKMRTNTNLFMINMCVADILFTITNPVIGVIRYQGSWQLGESLCGVFIYNEVVCGVVSIWSMTLISMDRHRCIVKSLYKHLTSTVSKVAIVLCWVLALGLAVPVIIYFKVEEFEFGTDTVKICTLMWPKKTRFSAVFVTFSCLIGFFIPLIIILYNYISIFKTLWRTRQTMIRQLSTNVPKKSRQPNERIKNQMITSARNRRDFRVVKMLVATVVIFGLMWLPLCVVFILILRDGITEEMKTSSCIFLMAACISFANACVNPVIYGLFNEKFRVGIRAVLHRCFICGDKEKQHQSAVRTISAMADMDRSVTPTTSSCGNIPEAITAVEPTSQT